MVTLYSKTPIYRGYFLPPNRALHINVNKQNPALPQTPIYRGCFLSPKLRGKSGFTVVTMVTLRHEAAD